MAMRRSMAPLRLQIFPLNAKMREDANLLIFPTLDAANIAYNCSRPRRAKA